MRIKAVLFDIGETLWHSLAAPTPSEFRRRSTERVAAAMGRLGIDDADPALVSRGTWVAIEEAIRGARASNLEEPDYMAVAHRAMASLGLAVDEGQAAELLDAVYVSGEDGGKTAFPDARPTLEELRRRGFLLATVTNRAFGGRRFREDLRAAGLDIGWDAEAVSVEVGFLKPHPTVFRHVLEALRTAPEEALMVGNSLREDVAGAQALGIATAWKRCPPDAEGVTPDFVIDEVSELLGLPPLRGVV